MSKIDFDAIPAVACTMNGGEFQLESNGEKSKTRKIKIKARSGQPIEHWFWGKIVHDLSGMRMHKARLPVDYAHNDSEVLGYLNHFDSSSGDLVASGALTPFKEDDRASEVIAKMDMGVPYEASIFFGGDGIALQDVADGESVTVNGYDFSGPGVIVREWPLRGVAVCPYGADANTETKSLSSKSSKHFRASVWKPEPKETAKKEIGMSEEIVAAPAVVEAEMLSVEVTKQEAAPEVKPVEALVVDAPVVEVKPEAAPVEAQPVEKHVELSQAEKDRIEFKRMKEDFGAEIAAEVFSEGGDYAAAQKLAYDRIKQENEKLRKQIPAVVGGQAAQFATGKRDGQSDDVIRAEYAKLTDPIERGRFRNEHAEALGITK